MLFLGNSIGLRYIQIYKKNMFMKCFAQNTKQITHSSHASYPSISLPVSKVLIWGIKLDIKILIQNKKGGV